MQKLIIIFDGGTSCNIPRQGYGKGYGSFKVGDHEIQRVEFGMGHSANSAEIRTLAEALEYTKKHFPDCGSVIIKGDSKIALSWLFRYGEPKAYNGKEPSENFVEAIKLLRQARLNFLVEAIWHPRKESVKLFGH